MRTFTQWLLEKVENSIKLDEKKSSFTKNLLSPKGLGLNGIEFNISDFKGKVEAGLNGKDVPNEIKELCKAIIDGAEKIDADGDKDNFSFSFTFDDFNKIKDSADFGAVASYFDEVIAAYAIAKKRGDNEKIKFPDASNNEVDDFYLIDNAGDTKNYSVKRGDIQGHSVEFGKVTSSKFLKAEKASSDDAFEIVHNEKGLNNLKKVFKDEKHKNFIEKVLKQFVYLKTTKSGDNVIKNENRIKLLWKLAFELFGNKNTIFNFIKEITGISNYADGVVGFKNEEAICKNIEDYCKKKDNNADVGETLKSEIESVVNPLLDDQLSEEKDVSNEWLDTDNNKEWKVERSNGDTKIITKKSIAVRRNYSKILHLLQIIICKELNEKWLEPANDLFRDCMSSKQAYVTIKNNIAEIKVIDLMDSEYKFSYHGATWNEAVSHSNITFVPNKNKDNNENI